MVIGVNQGFGQKPNKSYRLEIRKASSPINIDGAMTEEAWKDADVARHFYMVLPMDTSYADVRTDVRMTYDDENLYLLAVCYKPDRGPNVVESLRRDFNFGSNDNFLVFIDPFNDQTNGFSFGANAAGAEWDGEMHDGGHVNLSWDNKWVSSVKNYKNRWVFEAAIPFKSIRYKDDLKRWGINFSRLDVETTEKSAWAPVPRQFPTASLAYTGTLVWDDPPPSAGSNISLIPYLLGGVKDRFQTNTPLNYKREMGMDAKVGINSSLNLDLTVNPDFSQVEVDKQVTNLDRYELFFPEKRQFFLENGDLFANFGSPEIRPFFSRRIGLDAPINFGARLSGQLNEDWRIGVMDMQTGKVDNMFLPSQNFSVIALKRKVFSRSNIGAIVINKQSVNYSPESVNSGNPTYSEYNRNVGLEYNLASSNDLWRGNFTLLKSFSPSPTEKTLAHVGDLQFSNRNWEIEWLQEYVGHGYNAEVGYVPRTGYVRVNPQVNYLFFPKGDLVLSHGPGVSSSYYFDENFNATDYRNRLEYGVHFREGSDLNAFVSKTYIKLLKPFDPTHVSGDSLARGTEHDWNSFGAEFQSGSQYLLTYSASFKYGGYYANGTHLNIMTELGYRFQPYVSLSLNTSYNELKLPSPWNRSRFWLIGTRFDVTLTKNFYVTAFTQYNEQIKNLNINTRVRWRFKPASDLFLVYTDNYLPEPFSVKNRALVFKIRYWWNL